jgi:hypothetical protein
MCLGYNNHAEICDFSGEPIDGYFVMLSYWATLILIDISD